MRPAYTRICICVYSLSINIKIFIDERRNASLCSSFGGDKCLRTRDLRETMLIFILAPFSPLLSILRVIRAHRQNIDGGNGHFSNNSVIDEGEGFIGSIKSADGRSTLGEGGSIKEFRGASGLKAPYYLPQ